MQIKAYKKEHTLLVSLAGELDHHSAGTTREGLDVLLMDPEVRELALDMRGISFMDSSGLGVVLGRYKTMAERGGSMRITGASRYAERILKMAGVYSLMEKGEYENV